jgi:hypothetical protein
MRFTRPDRWETISADIERFYGLKFEFRNCHVTAAFRTGAVGGEEHLSFISPEAQILAQSPELVDC